MVLGEPFLAYFGRRLEYQADRFYLRNGGTLDEMRAALDELAKQNLRAPRQCTARDDLSSAAQYLKPTARSEQVCNQTAGNEERGNLNAAAAETDFSIDDVGSEPDLPKPASTGGQTAGVVLARGMGVGLREYRRLTVNDCSEFFSSAAVV